MLISNVCRNDLYEALRRTNQTFEGNISFWYLASKNERNTRWIVRLCVDLVEGKGVKRLHPQRMSQNNFYQAPIAWACWHSHGEFFNNLLMVQPKTRIHTGIWYNDKPGSITKDNWEWEPVNLTLKTGGREALMNGGLLSNYGRIQVDLNRSNCFCLGEDFYMKQIVAGNFYNRS